MFRSLGALICLVSLCFPAFSQEFGCMNYNEASQDPSQAHCVYIDCRNDDCDQFLSRIEEYSALHTLELINMGKDYFPKDLGAMKQLNTIIITQSPSLNYTNLFRKFAALPGLTKLVLDNNGIAVLPKTMLLMNQLKSLVIRNNENFNVEKSILQLNHLGNLKELSLPVNQISDLPENISLLSQLEVLDLSDNQLVDLPNEMGDMDSLEVLNIEKNVFINPLKTLEKLKGLNIKYLSMDIGMNERDREKLSKIFPKAEIVEVIDTSSMEDEIFVESFEGTTPLLVDTTEVEFRTIMVDGAKFQVLSDAYLHYPLLFDHPNFKSNFDSLLFEERYLDTTYANTWKIQPWKTYDNIRLYYYKDSEKGEIWFDFHPDSKKNEVAFAEPYIAKNSPELLSFLGLKWIYQGDLTKNQFIRKYIKTEKGYRYWMEARIYYNESDKNFTIELKDKSGFTQIRACLRNRSKDVSLEKTQESYALYYEKYVKALDNRRKRFHKRLLKDKSAYDITLERSYASAWESFRKVYMCPEEQHMTIKNWLEYYDKVIADEQSALKNAGPTSTLLERSLVINHFRDASNEPLLSDTTKMKGVYGLFRDEQQNMVVVLKVLLLNLDEKSFRTFEGSLGLKSIRLYFDQGAKYAIIAAMRNGDMGVLPPAAYSQTPLIQNMEVIFTLKRLPYKISSISQIQDLIGY